MKIKFEEFVKYGPSSRTGLVWVNDVKYTKILAGDCAGASSGPELYYQVCIKQRRYKCHNIVYVLHNGQIPSGMIVDHKNRIRTDNRIENLRLVTKSENSRNVSKYSNNKSGKTGVYYKTNPVDKYGVIREYWVASWMDLNGKSCSKNFSVSKYGKDASFTLAVQYRHKMISKLNSSGAGYTSEHGELINYAE